MVAECPPDASSTTPRVTDLRIRWNTALSILNHRQPSEQNCILAARALLGDDVIAEAGE